MNSIVEKAVKIYGEQSAIQNKINEYGIYYVGLALHRIMFKKMPIRTLSKECTLVALGRME